VREKRRSLDPVVLITACALATERLGLVLTASTTFSQPYNLARSLLTLDQVSRGRVGWNIVTTADAVAGLNFGMMEMPSSDLRYEMAANFTAAVRALWDSWDDGAAAGSNEGAQILRRPYSYNDGVDFTIERWPPRRQGVEYDAGLLFVATSSTFALASSRFSTSWQSLTC
jgi:alkanesulfonate monooxygenase SsuD/methylene tetrahydromethanopterin reductase-like flavin-dependent oxidoreductase (luciferase family)